MTQPLVHNDSLEWPNGLGFTPCTEEYRRLFDEQMAIFDPNTDSGTINDLDKDDYNRWNMLDDKLAGLQMAGHLLPGERI
jgi:hypothetical protein